MCDGQVRYITRQRGNGARVNGDTLKSQWKGWKFDHPESKPVNRLAKISTVD